jgi:hypothetical protein
MANDTTPIELLLRMGVKRHELHMYGYADNSRTTVRLSEDRDGEYSGWDDVDDIFDDEGSYQLADGDGLDGSDGPDYDEDSDDHEPMTVSSHMHGSYNYHPHDGDNDHTFAALRDEEDGIDSISDPFAIHPARSNQAPQRAMSFRGDGTGDILEAPNKSTPLPLLSEALAAGDQSDLVTLARAICMARYGNGQRLEDLSSQEQTEILNLAAQAGGYAGDGNPRKAPQGDFELPPEVSFLPDAASAWKNPNIGVPIRQAKMSEHIRRGRQAEELREVYRAHETARQDLEGEAVKRAATKLAKQWYNKKPEQLDAAQLSEIYRELSEHVKVRRA